MLMLLGVCINGSIGMSLQHAMWYNVVHAGVIVTFKEKLHVSRQANWLARCREQEAILLEEMDKYLAYYNRVHDNCLASIDCMENGRCCNLPAPFIYHPCLLSAGYVRGWIALLYQQAEYASYQLSKGLGFVTATGGKFKIGTHWRLVPSPQLPEAPLM
jgi:hypothetical protein